MSPDGTTVGPPVKPSLGPPVFDGQGRAFAIDDAGFVCCNGVRITGKATLLRWLGGSIFARSPTGGIWWQLLPNLSWKRGTTADPVPPVVVPPVIIPPVVVPPVVVPPVVIPPAGMPTSADFTRGAIDVRGGDNGYCCFPRLSDGRGISFGGFSHDRFGKNSVAVYSPVPDSWEMLFPHTPWVDGPTLPDGTKDNRGMTFLGNRDNHGLLVCPRRNELWCLYGARGVDITGNYSGQFNYVTKTWAHIDDTAPYSVLLPVEGWTPLSHPFDGACIWDSVSDTGVVYHSWGDLNHSCLTIVRPNVAGAAAPYKAEVYHNLDNPAFTTMRFLRYTSNQGFVRRGKFYIYGGYDWQGGSSAAITEIDVSVPGAPVMRIISINALPVGQRVESEAILADYDPVKDMVVATNGKLVNVYDWASGVWLNVPVLTLADPDRESPSPGGAGRAGFWSPETNLYIILGGHAQIYRMRLNFGTPAPIPTPAPTPTPTPTPTPPPPPGSPPPPSAGTLTVTTTPVPYTGPGGVLGRSKNLDFARIGNRWYKTDGDHAGLTQPSAASQDGRQERISFNPAANDWRLEANYYDTLDVTPVQFAFPDDSFSVAVPGATSADDEIWFFPGPTANQFPADTVVTNGHVRKWFPAGVPNVAQQVYGAIMGWKPSTKRWRIINDTAWPTGLPWRGIYDPVRKHVIVPGSSPNGVVFFVYDALTGADITPKSGPDYIGNRVIPGGVQVAGMAVDWVNRIGYVLDIYDAKLYSISLDTFDVNFNATMVADIPFAKQTGGMGVFKICWEPNVRAVVMSCDSAGLMAYQPDVNALAVWSPRPDGIVAAGVYLPPSTIFYDPDLAAIISIGTMDWASPPTSSPGYWKLKLTA